MAIATVQATSAIKILEHAARLGVPEAELLRAASLDASVVRDADARIPFRSLAALYEHGARLTGDPVFGLHVGEASHPRMFDVLGHAALSSSTLGAAFERILRYYRVLQQGAKLELDVRRDLARVRYTIGDPSAGRCRHEVEATLAIVTRLIRVAVGRPIALREVAFAHAPPRRTSEHRRVFGVAPLFRAADNHVDFDAALLAAPLVSADSNLDRILERLLRRMLEQVPDGDDVAALVRERVAASLRGGPPSASRVAAQLGLSERTLQRRLAAQRTSFRDVVDDVRRELGLELVAEPQAPMDEVAVALGYTDVPTFYRAFRRWTGGTPLGHRRRVRASAD